MTRGREIALGVGVLGGGAALWLLIIPAQIRTVGSQLGEVSPAFFPDIIAVVLMLLGAIHALQHLLRPSLADAPGAPVGARGTLRALAALGIGIVYVVALPRLGFFVSTALALFGLTIFLGGGRWWRAAPFAVVLAWVLQELFGRLMSVPLPRAGWFD